MRFFRFQRVASLIREKLSWMIAREIEVTGALITVTDVEVGKKLEQARVLVSVLPSEKRAEALKELGRRTGELQFKLNRLLNIKPMPKIYFEIDYGVENAAKVEKLLLEDNNGE